MTWRFAEFELDDGRRELRLRGCEIVLEPRVLDVLLDLVRHRDRVVTKDELLDRLWPGTLVTDSSLQRAVSLARSALRAGDAADAIRTYPRRGYRFCADIEELPVTAGPPASAGAMPPGRHEFEEGDWEGALARLSEADRAEGLHGAGLERAAQCHLNLGRPAEAVPFLERAAAAHSAAGDPLGAARVAVLLCQVHLEGRRLTIARGWQQRARRLLGDREPCRELAQLEWMTGRIAIADGNLEAALEHAERAVALAQELEDVDLEAVALVYLGHVRVARGDVKRGLEVQDEAAALVMSGAVAPWFAGLVYCGLIYVCQNRGDWGRAAEWTEGFSRWSERCPTSTYPAVCRLHRAEALTVRGELAAAEVEVTGTRDELEESAPWAVGDASRLLGDLRLARGDLEGAEEAYRRASALGWDPCPGWADLLVERGDPEAAVRALERALDDPSWACRQRRRLLLAALARAHAAHGNPEAARQAVEAAERAEDQPLTVAQRGAVERARAEIAAAEGRGGDAVRTLRAAVRHWEEAGCPMEVAPLRARMAELLLADGDARGAELELEAAEAVWREAGASGRIEQCAVLRQRLARA